MFCNLTCQALLKKHEALMSDLDAYGSVIDGLREQAKECKVSLLLIAGEFMLNMLNNLAH